MSIETILEQHGPLVGLKDNPVQRAYAAHIAEAIDMARADGRSGQVFAEAETGVGKTIGYLVAAGLDCVRHGSRAIVSTYTIALQNQIMRDGGDMDRAIRIVEAQTGVRLTAAIRVGARNFVDAERAKRVCEFHRQKREKDPTPKNAEDLSGLLTLEAWSERNPGGDLRGFLDDHGLSALPCGILFDDICITSSTPKSSPSQKVYNKHREASRDADIVVTNHAMLMSNARARGLVLHSESDSRDIGALIVDECDRLPDAAESFGGDLTPIRDFMSAAKTLSEMKDGSSCADQAIILHSALGDLLAVMETMRDTPKGIDDVKFWDELGAASQKLLLPRMADVNNALRPIQALKVRSDAKVFNALNSVQDYGSRFLSAYALALGFEPDHGSDDPAVKTTLSNLLALRWSPNRSYPSFRVFRLKPARLLKALWQDWVALPGSQTQAKFSGVSRAKCLILTSATISTPSSKGGLNLGDMRNEYGIWEGDNACAPLNARGLVFAPKRFGEARFVFSDPSAPKVFIDKATQTSIDDAAPIGNMLDENMPQRVINPEWVNYAALAVKSCMGRGGRALVVCTSFDAAHAISESLRSLLSGSAMSLLIEHKKGERLSEVKKKFAANPHAVLITPSAWEGFDITRDVPDPSPRGDIAHVVITQLPYAPPDTAVAKALIRHLIFRGKTTDEAKAMVFWRSLGNATRKMRQVFGRGIRGEDNAFTCWLVDPRFPRSVQCTMYADAASARPDAVHFKNAIPKRFRDGSAPFGGAWDSGSMLMASGKVVEPFDMAMEPVI